MMILVIMMILPIKLIVFSVNRHSIKDNVGPLVPWLPCEDDLFKPSKYTKKIDKMHIIGKMKLIQIMQKDSAE